MKDVRKAIEACDVDILTKELKKIDILSLNAYKTEDNKSLLHLAIKFCGKNIIELLVNSGMDINLTNLEGYPILELLPFYNDRESIEYCIDHGAKLLNNEGYLPLHWCATYNEVVILKKILSTNHNINIDMKDLTTNGERDRTALHWAAQEGNSEIAHILYENGADVNAKNFILQTPLHIAAGEGHIDFVKTLLDLGADADMEDNYGSRAKDIALSFDHLEIVSLFK